MPAAPAPDRVRLVLIRHGERQREGGELASLTEGGRSQAEALGAWLQPGSLFRADAILSSESRHSREHAEIVSGLFRQPVPVLTATALTPHTAESEFSFAALRRETARTIDWPRAHVVLCVGHEPRLGQLALALTGTRPDPLQKGEMLSVEGDSWEALERGQARLGTRVQPTSPDADEGDLLPKIQSKMQTSALLAGFSSATFGVVLTQSDYWAHWPAGAAWPSGPEGAAVGAGLVLLAVATLLFVVSIYMYDRLALPRRYWDDEADGGDRDESGQRVCPQDRWRSFRRDRVRHGLLYAYMVWVWRFVFSVAVGMAMMGFLALVLHRGVWVVALIFVAAIVAVIAYYVRYRPELGID